MTRVEPRDLNWRSFSPIVEKGPVFPPDLSVFHSPDVLTEVFPRWFRRQTPTEKMHHGSTCLELRQVRKFYILALRELNGREMTGAACGSPDKGGWNDLQLLP